MRDSFIRSGFSSPTGLSPDEATGDVALGHSSEELQLQAIGEWGISVTPLELLHGYRDLAALAQTDANGMLAPVFEGLQQSVTYGMGRMAQPDASMKVAGKTGTAMADEGPWTHAWFAGYAPAENPRDRACRLPGKRTRWQDAASVAREIFAAFAADQSAQCCRSRQGSAEMKRLLAAIGSAAPAVYGGRSSWAITPPRKLLQLDFRRPCGYASGICIRRTSCGFAPMPVERRCELVQPAKRPLSPPRLCAQPASKIDVDGTKPPSPSFA